MSKKHPISFNKFCRSCFKEVLMKEHGLLKEKDPFLKEDLQDYIDNAQPIFKKFKVVKQKQLKMNYKKLLKTIEATNG